MNREHSCITFNSFTGFHIIMKSHCSSSSPPAFQFLHRIPQYREVTDEVRALIDFQFLHRIPPGIYTSPFYPQLPHSFNSFTGFHLLLDGFVCERARQSFNSFTGFHIFNAIRDVIDRTILSIPSPDSTPQGHQLQLPMQNALSIPSPDSTWLSSCMCFS